MAVPATEKEPAGVDWQLDAPSEECWPELHVAHEALDAVCWVPAGHFEQDDAEAAE